MYCLVDWLQVQSGAYSGLYAYSDRGSGAQVTADHGNADDMVQRAKKTNAPLKNDKGELQLLTSHTLVRRLHLRRPAVRTVLHLYI
jgi:hypothetical protein